MKHFPLRFLFLPIFTLLLLVVGTQRAEAQGQTKWLQVGSLHNWFSEKGWEIEEGNQLVQQFGLRWPAQYKYKDLQAAKGMWVGTTNFTDERGNTYPFKVVHIGPRVNGDNEFFPLTFDLYAKFEPPRVFVDGAPSFSNPEEIKAATDTLKADRVLVTRANSAIGLTLERKIYAFSQQHHDNYHIFEMTFTNTGNTDADADIELPNKTLTGVYIYFQFRYSVSREVRYIVNNSAGWGINTMNDARGFPPDIANTLIPASQNDVKAQFAWHGLHKDANRPTPGTGAPTTTATFDNIGAPIWNPTAWVVGSTYVLDPADTLWRLGGAQFVGYSPIYAPKSAADRINDSNQPTTTNYIGSDEPLTRSNSQFNTVMMEQEYTKMTEGHAPRHAWLVEPQGKFTEQTVMANIGVGAPGGFSSGMGYGPYTLTPGQSITLIFAEGANGLTREEAVRIGKKYKDGVFTTKAKNDSVFLGQGRLLETFRRAAANYNSGFNIPQPPYPPAQFDVRGGGNKISLTWEPNPKEPANGFAGYRIYRALGKSDSTYHLIFQAGGTKPADPKVKYSSTKVYSFDDETAIRGVSYYYYIVSFSNPLPADPATRTPAGELESSRFYTQTYDAAYLKRPAGPPPQVVSDTLRAAIIMATDTTKIEFELAESIVGASAGITISDFSIVLLKKSGEKVIVTPEQGTLPIELRGTAGTRAAISMKLDTADVKTVWYKVEMYNVQSAGMVRMYVNGGQVALSPSIVTPFKKTGDAIRIAPNPYIISSNENVLRFPDEPDKIAFFNIPGNCVIKIYTELGELIKEIIHNDGTGDAYWNLITSSNQVIVSGVYIVVVENKDTGEKTIKKFVVIR